MFTQSLVLALYKGQTLWSQTFTISRDETQKEKQSPDVTIATIHLFQLTSSCGLVVEKLLLVKPN